MTSPQTIASVTQLFSSLSDATRLRLLSLISQNGETCVCDLVDSTGLNQTTVSRHLSNLRHAGLVTGRKAGQWVYYSLVKPRNEVHRRVLLVIKNASDEMPELQDDFKRLKASSCSPNMKPIGVTLPSKNR